MNYKRTMTALVLATGIASGSAMAQGLNLNKPLRFSETATTPSLNFYGLPGLVDLPSAEGMPDGQLAVTVSYFGGQTRTTLTFQALPRVTASFRYVGIQDLNIAGFDTYRDRSFDVRFQLLREGKYLPAFAVGLQDFSGTGIYAAEYFVATKNLDRPFGLPGRVKVTAGLGFGRLGTSGDIGSPFSDSRPSFVAGSTGGDLATDQWFRGTASPFAGIEWRVNDRLGIKAEYSTDAYELETRQGVFTRDSRLNFGFEYQYSDRLRLGGYWLYGSEVGLSAQLQFNPRRPLTNKVLNGPRPIIKRPSRASAPEVWATDWADSQSSQDVIRDALRPELEEDGIRLQALSVSATEAELRIQNNRYRNTSVAVGRAARTMARILPASVETIKITPMRNGLAQSTVVFQRSSLENLEFEQDAAGRLLAETQFEDAQPKLAGASTLPDTYPRFAWSIGPYIAPSYFDPDQPVRADAGLAAEFRYRFARGWLLAGEVRARAAGNIEDGRLSNSIIPRVRTDAVLYAQETEFPIEHLYVAHQWKAGKNTYARVTAGYLESFFGGVSAELLWKPEASKLAFGVEANYARQREFDQLFGFQDYDIVTGHASVYYELGDEYLAQLDVGRYLAGDQGGTFTLTREFSNGWRVGGFFTLTDLSSAEFGEGSFDKGITVTVPIDWFLGRPARQSVTTTVRPVQRDGGARLNVPGRLYDQVREGQRSDLVQSWSRVWE